MSKVSEVPLSKLTSFLDRLEDSSISFQLRRTRLETVIVEIAVPGERWEVEFFGNGHVEVEVFRVDGYIRDEKALDELFTRFAD